MAYQFGDVVLVPFPFTDQSTTKQRPGVIVSSSAYHRARRDLILMAITSHVRGSGAFGEVIVQDWQAAKLLKPSAIKPVIAIEVARFLNRDPSALTKLLARHPQRCTPKS